MRGASDLLRRVRVVSYTGTWDEKVDGSQQQSHLYLLLLPPDLLNSFLSSLPVSSFSLSTIWLVEDQERLLSTSGIYFPIDSQVYGCHTRLGRVEIEEVYQVLCLACYLSHLQLFFHRWRAPPRRLFNSLGLGPVELAFHSPSFICLRGEKTSKATFSGVKRSTSPHMLWSTWMHLNRAELRG